MDIKDRSTILIVDDQVENIDILRNALKDSYKIIAAIDGQSAIKLASRTVPDIILLDIMMPGIDGCEICRQLKQGFSTRDIPIIFVTAMSDEQDESKGLAIGAIDYITKPISSMIVKQRIKTHLALHNEHQMLEDQVTERTKQLELSHLDVVYRLGRAAEYKDNETGMHVKRMSQYSHVIALAAGLSESDANLVLSASPMHDIGKIGIPDNILLKPGKLDADEWHVMQTHVQIGADILANSDSILMSTAAEIALSHHEKWDGSGYPNQLKGESIPLVGRIVAIADVFDALTSSRPYKKTWTVEDAVNLINAEAGKHFDPSLVPLFNDCLAQIIQIKNANEDS